MTNRKNTKVRDIKPIKDAKGGAGLHKLQGAHPGPAGSQGAHPGPAGSQTLRFGPGLVR